MIVKRDVSAKSDPMICNEPQALVLRDKLTASEAAEELGISSRRLRKLCQQGRIGTLYIFAGREFYLIDARLIQRTFEGGETSGRPVKVIYHSHCDCGAYFSREDQAGASPDGVPSYPVTYLVTSVREGGVVDDHKLFTFSAGAWVEMPFDIVD